MRAVRWGTCHRGSGRSWRTGAAGCRNRRDRRSRLPESRRYQQLRQANTARPPGAARARRRPDRRTYRTTSEDPATSLWSRSSAAGIARQGRGNTEERRPGRHTGTRAHTCHCCNGPPCRDSHRRSRHQPDTSVDTRRRGACRLLPPGANSRSSTSCRHTRTPGRTLPGTPAARSHTSHPSCCMSRPGTRRIGPFRNRHPPDRRPVAAWSSSWWWYWTGTGRGSGPASRTHWECRTAWPPSTPERCIASQ